MSSAGADATLMAPPPLFDLPSASVEGLAAECALRACFVDFNKLARWTVPFRDVQRGTPPRRLEQLRVRGPILAPVLVVAPVVGGGGDGAAAEASLADRPLAVFGVAEVVALLTRNGLPLRAETVASAAQRGVIDAVEALVSARVAPAAEYLLLADPPTYAVVAPSQQRECGVLDLLTLRPAAHRGRRMRAIEGLLDVDGIAAAAAVLERGLIALERLLVAGGAQLSSGGGGSEDDVLGATRMFAGTAQPTAADCFAFGAASFVFHGNFPPSSHLAHLRAKLLGECPLLRAFTDGMQRHFFESYGGSLRVRPVPRLDQPADADVYAPGRAATVALTAAFAVTYFAVVNADTIVALLGLLLSSDDDDDDDGNGDDGTGVEEEGSGDDLGGDGGAVGLVDEDDDDGDEGGS